MRTKGGCIANGFAILGGVLVVLAICVVWSGAVGGRAALAAIPAAEYGHRYGALPAALERVSVATDGTEGNAYSYYASISADGRYVVFSSDAPNLVAYDTNGLLDVFVRDCQTGETTRVNVDSLGNQTTSGLSYEACVSADGRFVAFTSEASNLVAGDTNDCYDVFVHDRQTGITERVSVNSAEEQALNGYSTRPDISADGRYVVFDSDAANLVAGDTSGYMDVFVRDRTNGTTERLSLSSAGAVGNGDSYGASISADGRYVSFTSFASTLVSADTNDIADIFVRDRQNATTTRVSVSTDGAQGNDYAPHENTASSISADGRYVAFQSMAWGLVDPGSVAGVTYAYVHDRQTGATTRASVGLDGGQGNGGSYSPSTSADGRYVVFSSEASNLVTGDTNGCGDVFVYDRQTGITTRVSEADGGAQLNDHSSGSFGSLSSDGRLVAFSSRATNLVADDLNGVEDVFRLLVGSPVTYDSIRGSHRYHTAQLISQAMFPGGLPADSGLVIAPGETFQEALCGAPLAAMLGGPVLLTPTVGLENGTKAEIQRLGPALIFCIGLSETVINQVAAAVDDDVLIIPINGTDVYDMSYQVAAWMGVGFDMSDATAIVTVGYNFPDAIGVAPLACANWWPILLTNSGGDADLHASAAQALSELGIVKALKVGTYATLPGGIDGVGNLSGGDRYYTNANVATWAKAYGGLSFAHTAFATGDKFPDALASGPYLAQDNGTLLLSPLLGPLPTANIAPLLSANAAEVEHVTFIACIEPVISQVKALLP